MPRSESAPSGDVGWNFGEMVDGSRHNVRCKLCGKVIKAGITRLKQHLAHERGQVDPCTKASQEVREQMQLLLREMRGKKREKEQIKNELHKRLVMGDEIETDDDDDDDEDADIRYARMESMREYREMEEMQRFRVRSGQSYDVGGGSSGSTSKSMIGKAKKGFSRLFGLNRSSSSRGRQGGSSDKPIDIDSAEMRLRAMDPVLQRSKSAKQPRIDERIMKGKREELGAAVSKLLIFERLPMAVADSPWLPALLQKAIDLGPGVKVPTAYEVGNKYLKQEYDGLKSWITGFKGIWKQRGVTIMCDGWTGTTQMHIINFLIYSSRGTVFHKSIDASLVASRDTDYYFKLMDDVVEEIGEEIVVQIVTDNEAAMKAAGQKLMRKRKHLYWTACAAHCMDLIFEDIGKSKSVNAVLNDARSITSFIYNSKWVANTMKQFTSGRQLLRPGITRFATNFIALQSIVREKEGLRNMFTSQLWKTSKWGKEKEGPAHDVNQLINSDEFWKKARDVLKVHEPLLKVLRLVDGDNKPTMGFIYEAMDRAKLAIKRDCRYSHKYWKIIDNRWSFQLHTDLHSAGYYLNPQFQYSRDISEDDDYDVVFRGTRAVIQKLEPDMDNQIRAINQLTLFKDKMESFGTTLAQRAVNQTNPAEWWLNYGESAPELRRIAVRVLSQTTSSSNCERNWSTFSLIHTKTRNRLKYYKLQMLVYCYYNMRLKIRHLTRSTTREIDEGFNPINLDYIFEEDDPLSLWLEEREAPLLDGQDNSWMNSDNEDDDNVTVIGSQARPVDAEPNNDPTSLGDSDSQNSSGDSDDDNNDSPNGGGTVGVGVEHANEIQDLPPSPYRGEAGLGAVDAFFEIGDSVHIPRRRRSNVQPREVESQRDIGRRSRLSRTGSLNSTSNRMHHSFRRLGVDEPSSSFDSYGPPRYNYPPPPPPHYYHPPPHVYYPPRQSSPSHFASSSSSSHYHDQEDSRKAFQGVLDYLYGGHGSDSNSQSMSDDYEELPRRSTWWM